MTASSCSERTSIFFCAQAGSFMFSASQTQWYSRCAKRRSVFIRTARSRTVFADKPPFPSSLPFFFRCSRKAESSFAVSLATGIFPKYGTICRSSMNQYRSRVEVFTSACARYCVKSSFTVRTQGEVSSFASASIPASCFSLAISCVFP